MELPQNMHPSPQSQKTLFSHALLVTALSALLFSCSSPETITPAKQEPPASGKKTATQQKNADTLPPEKTAAIKAPPERVTSWPINVLRKKCIDFKDLKIGAAGQASACSVASFGSFGSTENKTYYYATYCITPPGQAPAPCGSQGTNNPPRALAIFTAPQDSDTINLFLERAKPDYMSYSYEQPVINKTACGTILDIPTERIFTVGQKARYARETYLLKNDSLSTPIDTLSWAKEFKTPDGMELRKELWADMYSLKATARLYRPSDPDTAPTGGFAYIKLSCENNALKIAHTEIETFGRSAKNK